MAELVVYGRSSCSACSRFKGSCEHGGLKYRFADIDVAENKAEMLRKLRAAEWFKGGKFGLPLVDVYGRMVQRPSFAEVKAAKAALPEEDKVEKIKAQFKDLDLNGDGTLSFQEMQILLQSLAPKLSEGQQQQLFCAADVNQNGVVELDEFIDFVMYGKEASASVEKAEKNHPSEDVVPVMVAEPDGFDRWKEQTLTAHNDLRAQHGALALRWSDECYRNAKKQADACQAAGKMLKGNCEGSHGRQGQNLYWNPCGCPHSRVMVQSWVDEAVRPGYDFDKASTKPGTEQFTQVVWRATTQVGMALSEDERFCVANYYPAGNIGSFQENVRPPGTAVPHPWRGALEAAKGSRKATRSAEAVFEVNGDGVEILKVKTFPHLTINELLEPCPGSDFEERIEKAFQEGADLVTLERLREPGVIHIRVKATRKDVLITQFRRGFNQGAGLG